MFNTLFFASKTQKAQKTEMWIKYENKFEEKCNSSKNDIKIINEWDIAEYWDTG